MPFMQLQDWGIKLIHQLIVYGADFNELSLKDTDTPLHCALSLALTTGKLHVFEIKCSP